MLRVVEIDFWGYPTFSECPAKSIDCCGGIVVEIGFTYHAVAGTMIGEPGGIDFSDTTDSEMGLITLPQAVSRVALKSYTRGLQFGFNLNKEPVFFCEYDVSFPRNMRDRTDT